MLIVVLKESRQIFGMVKTGTVLNIGHYYSRIVQFYDGKVLFTASGVAMDPACCCAGEGECLICSDNKGPGIITVTISDISSGCCSDCSEINGTFDLEWYQYNSFPWCVWKLEKGWYQSCFGGASAYHTMYLAAWLYQTDPYGSGGPALIVWLRHSGSFNYAYQCEGWEQQYHWIKTLAAPVDCTNDFIGTITWHGYSGCTDYCMCAKSGSCEVISVE